MFWTNIRAFPVQASELHSSRSVLQHHVFQFLWLEKQTGLWLFVFEDAPVSCHQHLDRSQVHSSHLHTTILFHRFSPSEEQKDLEDTSTEMRPRWHKSYSCEQILEKKQILISCTFQKQRTYCTLYRWSNLPNCTCFRDNKFQWYSCAAHIFKRLSKLGRDTRSSHASQLPLLELMNNYWLLAGLACLFTVCLHHALFIGHISCLVLMVKDQVLNQYKHKSLSHIKSRSEEVVCFVPCVSSHTSSSHLFFMWVVAQELMLWCWHRPYSCGKSDTCIKTSHHLKK